MNKGRCLVAIILLPIGQLVHGSDGTCSLSGPGPDDYPKLALYPKAIDDKKPDAFVKTAAIQDYLEAGKFCRKAYNFYENRAKCSESWKLGIGVSGGVLGFLGSMMAATATGGAAPGIAAGLAGVASVTLGTAEKGPLGTGAYEARRVSTQKTVEAGQKSFQAATTAEAIYQIAAAMAVACPLPSQ